MLSFTNFTWSILEYFVPNEIFPYRMKQVKSLYLGKQTFFENKDMVEVVKSLQKECKKNANMVIRNILETFLFYVTYLDQAALQLSQERMSKNGD